MIDIEICIDCDGTQSVFDAVTAAFRGGAQRIELCGAMDQDGLTPKRAHIYEARRAFQDRSGLMVMIRPRAGAFCYTPKELGVMCDQIEMAAEMGADGVVFGVLENHGQWFDQTAMTRLIAVSRARDLTVTCHRAFDAAGDQLASLNQLIAWGVDRVLTSGTAWGMNGSAVDGLPHLKVLTQLAKNRIEIIIGGGVRPNNVNTILNNLLYHADEDMRSWISLHAFSGARENGETTKDAVRKLFRMQVKDR